jgi:hypothetical protein
MILATSVTTQMEGIMGKVTLGHLEKAEAIEFVNVLWLIGSGNNPTTGWRNWFQPTKDAQNTYDFLQESPDGTVAPVVVSFRIINAFPGHGESEVIIRELVGNKPTEQKIRVMKALNLDELTFAINAR